MAKDFFTSYMDFVNLDASEAPANYHRWACASIIGALLGRQTWIPFGHSVIYPNQFIMLMGPPATKKGTVINIAKSLIKQAGYTRFAADRTSKERFLMDMKEMDTMEDDLELLTMNAPSESYITAGEFVDFIGQNDIGFLMTLTNLWDNGSVYEHKKITGKSVIVKDPTVNLLGGSTAATFQIAFPPETIGSGTLSRFILVSGEASGNKVAWPEPEDELQKALLAKHLRDIKDMVTGAMSLSPDAKLLGGEIYKNAIPVEDQRFNHYMQRRHIHMIKLSIILAASRLSTTIETSDILRANTMLAMADKKMPKALGEFGASRYSDATNKILEYLGQRIRPASAMDLWKVVQKDLSKQSEMGDILLNLKHAEKIQSVNMLGKVGYLPMQKPAMEWPEKFLDNNWLTVQERV